MHSAELQLFFGENIVKNLTKPIGKLGSVEGWKILPIKECGESLVPLGAFSDYLQIATDAIYIGEKESSPYSWQHLDGSLVTVFVREGIAKHLAQAASYLPPRHMLHVWDAFRPLSVQQALFDYYVSVLKGRGVDHEKAIVDAQQFVSIPSTDSTRPPPHNTGGAVDLTVICLGKEEWPEMVELTRIASQKETGENWRTIYEAEMRRQQIIREFAMPLPMGTIFDGVHLETATRFFEELATLSEDQNECLANRRLLYNVMAHAGFSNYSEEWWHFDLGNQFDSARTGRLAIYGAATLSEENLAWEKMRQEHYIGSVAIAEGRSDIGKIHHEMYPFVRDITAKTGNLRGTIHPQAAAL